MAFWTRPLAFLEQCRARYGTRFTLRLLNGPPFVILSNPDEIKQVFTAPADVLHPGEGARVLAPVVGLNSVILLDEDAHMEQRKLMLPAFHGDRVARLGDLVAAVAEREVDGWPEESAAQLHPLLQRLTLEVVLRAVFGLDPGPRLEALRERLSAMLAFGDRFVSLIPPQPGGRAEKVLERVGPFAAFVRLQREADGLLFELIDERRAEAGERDVLAVCSRPGMATAHRCPTRSCATSHDAAGHPARDDRLCAGLGIRAPEPASGRAYAALEAEIRAGDDPTVPSPRRSTTLRRRPVLPNVAPRMVMRPVEIGGRTYPAGVSLVPDTCRAPRPRHLRRAVHIPPQRFLRAVFPGPTSIRQRQPQHGFFCCRRHFYG